MTAVPGLFAAGDWTNGPRNVISAVADGRKAAFAIDQRFRGEASSRLTAQFQVVPIGGQPASHWAAAAPRVERAVAERFEVVTAGDAALALSAEPAALWTADTLRRRLVIGDPYESLPRQEMPVLDPAERGLAAEIEIGLTPGQLAREATRCLQCQLNIFVDGPRCILCNTCVDVCPQKVIGMVGLDRVASIDDHPAPADLLRARTWEHGAAMIIDESTCVRCGLCVQYCPTRCITMQSFEPAPAPNRPSSIALVGELSAVATRA
jgi:ferredoxin